MPVSADDVRNAYRFILGREPENAEVVAAHQRRAADLADLRRGFIGSAEFRQDVQGVPLTAPPPEVETVADPEALNAIIAKTGEAWAALGMVAPHHSVLSAEQYRPGRLAENESAFWESGRGDLDLVISVLRRIDRSPYDFRRCVEYGCGVGRVTAQLATVFREVVALDISAPHLEIAREHVDRVNVRFRQVTPTDLFSVEGYDLWFSRLVLQHNPPPVTLAILDRAFAGLMPHGVAIVHVPTYCPGYSFNVVDYLSGKAFLHMHATPQKPIFDLAWKRGCCLRDVREEGIPGWVTNIFAFEKVG